jgi:predicted O-methyltransferase YrrM
MNDVRAMLSPQERDLLRSLPEKFQAESILEIGVFVGGSTSYFAQGMDAGEIVCVDTFCFYRTIEDQPYQLQRWIENTNGWQKEKPNIRTIPLVGSVTTPAIRYFLEDRVCSFDIAFIDGAHDATSVLVDLSCILPAVRRGGGVVVHDHTEEYGVPFACSIFESAGLIEPVSKTDSVVVYHRTDKPWDDHVGAFVRGHFS